MRKKPHPWNCWISPERKTALKLIHKLNADETAISRTRHAYPVGHDPRYLDRTRFRYRKEDE
jgi:hypothetical protein